ncbi:MAG TPA: hypothetical protein VKS44_07045, partial [Candidatus Acidoferrales bacterium]|nr:hypothetical protein [Candidatus Acidoferrales bacterium]
YAPPGENGPTKSVTLQFKDFDPKQASVSMVDSTDGNSRTAYEKMGAPHYPTQDQIRELRKAAELAPPSAQEITDHKLTLTIPSHGLDVVELK